ncbi:MAG: hypothetical protein ACRDOI_40090 [Trebonia sp.]
MPEPGPPLFRADWHEWHSPEATVPGAEPLLGSPVLAEVFADDADRERRTAHLDDLPGRSPVQELDSGRP